MENIIDFIKETRETINGNDINKKINDTVKNINTKKISLQTEKDELIAKRNDSDQPVSKKEFDKLNKEITKINDTLKALDVASVSVSNMKKDLTNLRTRISRRLTTLESNYSSMEESDVEAAKGDIEELENEYIALISEVTPKLVVNETPVKGNKNKDSEVEEVQEDDLIPVTGSEKPKDEKYLKALRKVILTTVAGVAAIAIVAGGIIYGIVKLSKKAKSEDVAKAAATPAPSITEVVEATPAVTTIPVKTDVPENKYGQIQFTSIANKEELKTVTNYYLNILKENGFNLSYEDVQDSILTLNGNGELVEHPDYAMIDCVNFVDNVTNCNADYDKQHMSLAEMFTDDKTDTQSLLKAIDETVVKYQSGNKTKEALQELLDLTKALCIDDKYANRIDAGATFIGSNQFFSFGQEYRNYQDRNKYEFTTADDVVKSLTFDQVHAAANGVNNKENELTVKQAATRTLGLSLEKRDCLKK